MQTFKQVVLLILDGWGYRKETEYNAITQANPQYFNYLWEHYPHTLLPASGEAVGLPEGNIGTSELGHTILGSGCVIESDMVRINHAIQDNTLGNNEALRSVFTYVKEHNSTLHIFGMVSPGGVHSHMDHLFAILALAKKSEIKNLVIHGVTDGRDVPPKSAAPYFSQLEKILDRLGVGRVATISGRYYAMDRDTNWDRIQKEVDAIFEGKGELYENIPSAEIIENRYEKGESDEFILPSVIKDGDGNIQTIREFDGIINFNFRPDREREISQKIADKAKELNFCFVTITQYDKNIPSLVMFPPLKIPTTLAEQLAHDGLTQAHISETEKYAHVTYFFNGGNEEPHKGEKFFLIPSRKDVPTYDLAPHMRAEEIADKTVEEINKGVNFIVLNICNADMVGHTGKMEATIEAIKFADTQIERVVKTVLAVGGAALITADHGNAEIMYNIAAHQPNTAHTLDDVPAILTLEGVSLKKGGLQDVAPTILSLLGLEIPVEMTGKSLIQ